MGLRANQDTQSERGLSSSSADQRLSLGRSLHLPLGWFAYEQNMSRKSAGYRAAEIRDTTPPGQQLADLSK